MQTREGNVGAIKLTLRNYKHSDTSSPVDIFIDHEKPVHSASHLLEYLSLTGQSPVTLFCWPDASPISRSCFVTALSEDLSFCDLDGSRYKTHSFRIGAASWVAVKGMSDTKITNFGRWKSNCTFAIYSNLHSGFSFGGPTVNPVCPCLHTQAYCRSFMQGPSESALCLSN